jgi:hypothetical protein
MIFTDGIHLVADNIDELHSFAQSLGLKKEWFQNNLRHPHYDLTTQRARKRAIKAGARVIGNKELLLKAKKMS